MTAKPNQDRWIKDPMQVSIRNFGPIKKADINLRKLVVIIGRNNSGKSYLTTAIYSALRSIRTSFRYRSGFPYPRTVYDGRESDIEIMTKEIREEISNMLIEAFGSKKQVEFILPERTFNSLIQNYGRFVSPNLRYELVKAFAVPLSHLKRMYRHRPSITLSSPYAKLAFQVYSKRVDAELSFNEKKQPSIIISPKKKTVEIALEINDRKVKLIDMPALSSSHRDFDEVSNLVWGIELIISRIIDPTYSQLNYLPAARAGVAQTYKTLAAGSTHLYPMYGLDGRGIQRFSGAISNLAGTLMGLGQMDSSEFIEYENETQVFRTLSLEFEKRMTEGSIELKKSEYGGPPDIVFKQNQMEVPIHASASSIAELAPIFLYLKHLIRKHSFLIIEEPEAHLHPGNQLAMSRLIAKLVNLDVHTMITTHSDYLVESLSHLIRASKSPKLPKGISKEELLESSDVGVYLLVQDKDGATISKEQEVEEFSGIQLNEFNQILDILYGMARNVDRGIRELGNEDSKE